METTQHRFEFNMAGIDRNRLLEQAASDLDALRGHLDNATGGVAPTDEGDRTRAIRNDQALLPAFPDVYRITDHDFLARHAPAPVAFSELARSFDFYWIRFPVGLKPELNWGFNMIEVRIEFNEGAPPHTRPKAYQILPQKQFQTLVDANTSIEVTLNEKLEFEAKTGLLEGALGPAGAKASAEVGAVAKAGAGAVLGPFRYRIKKAKIDHSATGLEWVFWRIDGAEFFQEDSPELVVIAQVPKITKTVTVKAELQASRYFSYGAAPWQDAVKQIPALLRGFFENGMPLRDEKPWDITAAFAASA